MKKSINKYLSLFVAYAFVLVMTLYTLYPVFYTLIGSFKSNAELTRGGGFFPTVWRFENYKTALLGVNFLQYGINSTVVSVCVLIVAVITTSLAGYTFARKTFYGKKILMALYVALVFIAVGSVTLFPTYRVLMLFHLNKSLVGLILALVGGQITNVLLVMGFVHSIPLELDEAATIDGCTPHGVFFRVILPMLKPILAIVALFSFRTAWNDYLLSFIISIFTPSIKTLTVAVVQLKYAVNAAAEWHIMLAGASLAILPILILYAIANRQFIAGLTAGAVKG